MKKNAAKIDKYNLNLAGEFRVCSEILKRGVFATVTYGNKKGADIIAVGLNRRAALVEVKSSNTLRFVTGFYQKYKSAVDTANKLGTSPAFWVLYSVRNGAERFFVLTHDEMAQAQAKRNDPIKWATLSHEKRAQKWARGVDNVDAESVKEFESGWDKIIRYCNDRI